MSDFIESLEKTIQTNLPEENLYGQYNVGKIHINDAERNLGQSINDSSTDSDLCTLVETRLNPSFINYPKGFFNGVNSKFQLLELYTQGKENIWAETDKYTDSDGAWKYYNVSVAAYLYDGSTPKGNAIFNAASGDAIKAALGTDDTFGQTDTNNRFGYKDYGEYYGHLSNIADKMGTPTMDNFHVRTLTEDIKDNELTVETRFKEHFNKMISKSKRFLNYPHSERHEYGTAEDYYILIVRCRGDEWATNFFGEDGGNDERDRTYAKFLIKKQHLFSLFAEANGDHVILERYVFWDSWGTDYGFDPLDEHVRDLSLVPDSYVKYKNLYPGNYKDTYGNAEESPGVNDHDPVYWFEKVKIKIKAPTWLPENANLPLLEGGVNANWIERTHSSYPYYDGWTLWFTKVDLNKNIDFYGWPSEYYAYDTYLCHDSFLDSNGDRFTSDFDGHGWSTSYGLWDYIDDCAHRQDDNYSTDGSTNPPHWLTEDMSFYCWNFFLMRPDRWIGQDEPTFMGNGMGWNKSKKYFEIPSDVELGDWRPISYALSSFGAVDLQNYYEGAHINNQFLSARSSAPVQVELNFDIAKDDKNYSPTFIDVDNSDVKWYFYVANWDWKEGAIPSQTEPGGGACELSSPSNNVVSCIEEIFNSVPKDTFTLEQEQQNNNVFKIKQVISDDYIAANGIDWDMIEYYNPQIDLTEQINKAYNVYLEPGIKIIKVLFFNMIQNKRSTGLGAGADNRYWQPLTYKLATIKININSEGTATLPDFFEIGGDDFTYLPYPEIYSLPPEDGDGNTIHGFPPSDQDEGFKTYKSSHVVIGGLSNSSRYATTINSVVQANKFSKSEQNERINVTNAQKHLPIDDDTTATELTSKKAEYGKYFGNADIAQVRLFNNAVDVNGNGLPLDLTTLLYMENEIDYSSPESFFETHITTGDWGENSYFISKESPVGDIFINEYEQFNEYCLFEINCDKMNGKSFRDTSGNGLEGILFGDFSLAKESLGDPVSRDSFIKTPKKGSKKDGAF